MVIWVVIYIGIQLRKTFNYLLWYTPFETVLHTKNAHATPLEASWHVLGSASPMLSSKFAFEYLSTPRSRAYCSPFTLLSSSLHRFTYWAYCKGFDFVWLQNYQTDDQTSKIIADSWTPELWLAGLFVGYKLFSRLFVGFLFSLSRSSQRNSLERWNWFSILFHQTSKPLANQHFFSTKHN